MMYHRSRVILNIGGTRFEAYNYTLKKIPATRLSRLNEQLPNFDPFLNEYFFDRHPGVFPQILNYYRTGKLHYPKNVCGPLFEEELEFWGLDSNQVEPCCWMTYTKHRRTEETLAALDRIEKTEISTNNELKIKFGYDQHQTLYCYQRMRMLLWQMFEEPYSSLFAKVSTALSLFFIVLSVVIFNAESLPRFQQPLLGGEHEPEYIGILLNEYESSSSIDWAKTILSKVFLPYNSVVCANNSMITAIKYVDNCSLLNQTHIHLFYHKKRKLKNPLYVSYRKGIHEQNKYSVISNQMYFEDANHRLLKCNVRTVCLNRSKISSKSCETTITNECSNAKKALKILDLIANLYLAIEFIVRFIVSPEKYIFLSSIVNIIDGISSIWYFLVLFIRYKFGYVNYVLDLTSNVRVFRIFQVLNHHTGLRVIVASFEASASVLWLFVFVFIIGMIIGATMVYYAERMFAETTYRMDLEDKSIFHWWWFAVVTSTTVGYGDVVPKTPVGQLCGAYCAVIGVLAADVPMAIIVQTFSDFYKQQSIRSKLHKRRQVLSNSGCDDLNEVGTPKAMQMKQRGSCCSSVDCGSCGGNDECRAIYTFGDMKSLIP
ncbi:hypothetical protein GJ496_008183 [Pomphorhynchus laevis]|nr:hypothetical protein GJ496_008183 [Pomphorhynchus laevis]